MTHHLTLLDLVLVVVLVAVALGALRSGRGLLSALASAALTGLVVWLAAAVVLAVAPHPVREPVARSAFARTLDPPVWAVDQVVRAR